MTERVLRELLPQVRHNCLVSDAGHWGYYSICGLLMRLREQYRFEHDIAPGAPVDSKCVGQWIEGREAQWQRLDDEPLCELTIKGMAYSPFDAEGINKVLEPHALVYGGGYGVHMKPVFFLARLASRHSLGKYQVLVAAEELARDLSIHPAMSRGNTIIARSEMAYSLLYDRFEEFRAARREGTLHLAFASYGAGPDADHGLLRQIAASELDSYIHHEAGELRQTERLGPEWAIMQETLGMTHSALLLRGMKDALADTGEQGTLAHIISADKGGSLYFLISGLTGMRYTLLAPLREAVAEFRASHDWQAIELARRASFALADELAQRTLQTAKATPAKQLDSALRKLFKSACPLKGPG